MPRPAKNFLFLDIAQRQELAVVTHGPDDLVRLLRPAPLHDLVVLEQVIGIKTDVLAGVDVDEEIVFEVADDGAERLDVQNVVVHLDRRQRR